MMKPEILSLVLVLILISGVLPAAAQPCSTELEVNIEPKYTPPSSFSLDPPPPPPPPPFYRAASSLSLTCEVQGVENNDSLLYHWTSTGNSFVTNLITKTVFARYLESTDNGVHSCTVYDTVKGCSGNANITVRVVGAGIYVDSDGGQVLPNNSLMTTNSRFVIPNFRCLSGSSIFNTGNLIGPLGNDLTHSHSDPFLVIRGGSHHPGSLYVRSVRPLKPDDVGIYTYRTPDENGNIVDFKFGLYRASESEPPLLTNFCHSPPRIPFTISFLSHGSPPTKIIWEKDDERLTNKSHNGYQVTQTLVNRTTSTYNNMLTIKSTTDNVVAKYNCTVVNSLGTSNSLGKVVTALKVSGHESPVIVGTPRDITCTTTLCDVIITKMEWVRVGEMEVEKRQNGGQSLSIAFNLNDTTLNGTIFTCRLVTSGREVFEETITLEVKELEPIMSIDGPEDSCLQAGRNTFLVCTVTSHLTPMVKWVDPNNNEVLTTGTDVRTDDSVTVGNITRLVLNFKPLKTSHGGVYTCISTRFSSKRIIKHLKVRINSTNVRITHNPNDEQLFTTNQLNLTCTTYLDPAVDTPVIVTHRWEGPSGVITSGSNGRIISGVTGSRNQYSSVLHFNSLQSSDSGKYTCFSSARSIHSSLSVCGSELNANTTFKTVLLVRIEISYTPPDQYPDYSPPNYRAASSVQLNCVVFGSTGSVTYNWTSTCRDCYAHRRSLSSILIRILRGHFTGVHTCNVRDEAGNTGSNSTTMNVFGAGIYVYTNYSLYGSAIGAQPQNSYDIVDLGESNSDTDRYFRLRMICCSNSSLSKGNFTFPNGHVRSSGRYDTRAGVVYVTQHTSRKYAGCSELSYTTGTLYDIVPFSEHGIYTCTTSDTNGNRISTNIGLYGEGFSSFPSIYQLEQSDTTTFVCKTQNAPPTNINWFKDGERLEIDGDAIKMTTKVTDRLASHYEITLRLTTSEFDCLKNITCEVGNFFGTNKDTIEAVRIECDYDDFIVGEDFTCKCSSAFYHSSIEWHSETHINSFLTNDNYTSISIPITTEETVYWCQVTTSQCATLSNLVTIQHPQVPNDWCKVRISNQTGKAALHLDNHILLCTVITIPGMKLPLSVEWVGPKGTVLTSGRNVTVGVVRTQGNTSTVSLSFHPVLNSDKGLYTCKAAVHVPWMKTQPSQITSSLHLSITSRTIFQLKIYPISYCFNLDVRTALLVEESIQRELESAVRERCNCNFSSRSIYSGEFRCQSTYSIYRATINGTTDFLTTDQVTEHIDNWRETKGTFLYNMFRLKLSNKSECLLTIGAYDETEC